jgi:hypothetical protein
MSEDRFTIPGLEGRLILMFVSSISAAACFAEVDDGGDILLVCVRGQELERERALVGLGIVGPKNKVTNRTSQPVHRSSYRRVGLYLMCVRSV